MNATYLLHHLIEASAERNAAAPALTYADTSLHYADLASSVSAFASGLLALGVQRTDRVGVYMDKRPETVAAFFGASAAGAVFVPVNPVLKAEQVTHILQDCAVRVLVTSPERWAALESALARCVHLRHVVLVGVAAELPRLAHATFHRWTDVIQAPAMRAHRVVDADIASILYTSGSTGRPKGVVLSHRNMVIGAKSVVQYLENRANDTLLAVLPLSFDAGFSQLTTAFHAGARVVLLNYLLPQDVLKALERERVTGLTAVPPLWIQLSRLEWPESIASHLRYFANTGGRMPLDTLNKLRALLPNTKPYLMYGLTEAFRATYLPPEVVDLRPDSIGKAIPNAEVLVLRESGAPCAPNEPGELVQRGALVALGYWNDAKKTAERFKTLPVGVGGREAGIALDEIAVFSGDVGWMDEEGYLYFVGRRDEMIKTSGYRVSPTEVEEVLYATGMVGECAAFGIEHDVLGQAICVIVTAATGSALDVNALLAECRRRMPAYMVPMHIKVREHPLDRNANGKIDRNVLSAEWRRNFASERENSS